MIRNVLITTIASLLLLNVLSAQEKIYWTDSGAEKVQRSDLDGTNVEDLIIRGMITGPSGLGLDLQAEKIYFTDETIPRIQRANMNGTEIEDLLTVDDGLGSPFEMAVDAAEGKMYWADVGTAKIQRANLDGSDIEDLLTEADGLSFPTDFFLDVDNDKIYWTDLGALMIQRSDLDGGNIEVLITLPGGAGPIGMNVDPLGGKIYWTDFFNNTISRANLDGTDMEEIISGLDLPCCITFNPGNDKIYWKEIGDRRILRADADGSNIEPVVVGNQNSGLAFDQTTETMFWIEIGRIMKADFEGNDPEEIIVAEILNPASIELNPINNQMYWIEPVGTRFRTAMLDGTMKDDIIIADFESPLPTDISLDPVNEKIYWADSGTDKLHVANLDGSNPEDLIMNPVAPPNRVAIDVEHEKIYWSGLDFASNLAIIERADLDGSNQEEIFLGSSDDRIESIALDPANGKMYWCDQNFMDFISTIKTANLDGSDVEDWMELPAANYQLTIDTANNQLYWTDPTSGSIKRADFDGQNEETVVTNISSPSSVAILQDFPNAIPDIPIAAQGLIHRIFPNPTQGLTTIEFSNPAKAEWQWAIMDQLGRQMEVTILQTEEGFSFDSANLQSGVYFFSLWKGTERVAVPFVVRP